MSLANLLEHPNLRKVFLLELTAAEELVYWSGSGTTWTANTSHRVLGVRKDGVDQSSGWSWDADAGTVTITSIADPYANVWQAVVGFYLANTFKLFNQIAYQPLIVSAPQLTAEIEPRFRGLGRVSGGTLRLENRERWFDALESLDWDAGTAVLKLGADRLAGTTWVDMPYGDYETQGTWFVAEWQHDREQVELSFRDIGRKVDARIPPEVYTRDDFPDMYEDHEGRAKPIVLGAVRQLSPTCIDLTTSEFEVADHAIFALSRCTVGGTPTAFATTDLANARFTLASWDPDADGEVRVDVRGATTASGALMTNTADQIEYLLETWGGVTEIDQVAFAAARSAWVLGLDRGGAEVQIYESARYLGDGVSLVDVCQELAAAAGGVLRIDADGQFTLAAWRPVPGETAIGDEFSANVLLDNFTAANGTALPDHDPDIGDAGSWSGPAVGDTIQSNRFEANTQYDNSTAPSGANYSVSAVVRVTDTFADAAIIGGRYISGSADGYHIEMANGATELELYLRDPGTLDSHTQALPAAGEEFLLTLEMTGTSIKGYLDGVEILSATDSTWTAAGGIYIDGAGFEFDTVQVCDEIQRAALGPADVWAVEAAVQTDEVITRTVARYDTSEAAGSSRIVEAEDDAAQIRRAFPVHVTLDKTLPLSERRSAEEWGSFALYTQSQPLRTWRVIASHRAFRLRPGDAVQVTGDRIVSGIYEVLRITRNLDATAVELLLGNWRGFDDRAGYWMDDAAVFPDRLGGGSTLVWSTAWTAEQKAWARQNCAYWHDDDGFAVSSDADSRLTAVWA